MRPFCVQSRLSRFSPSAVLFRRPNRPIRGSRQVQEMIKQALFLGLLASVLATLGCAMCASPYDYCGPTYSGGDCGECGDCGVCDPMARAGSVLSPTLGGDYGQLQPMPPRTRTDEVRHEPTPATPPPAASAVRPPRGDTAGARK